MSASMSVCPVCPHIVPEGKDGQIRTDNLRNHVKNKHPAADINLDFVDAGGYAIKRLTPAIVIKHKAGKWSNGYCFACGSWLDMTSYGQANRERMCSEHVCKTKQVREHKLKVVDGKIAPPTQRVMTDAVLIKAIKAAGAEDCIEFKDNLDLDIDKTLKRMYVPKKAEAVSPVLDRLKQEKRLAALNLGEREQLRRDAIAKFNFEADSDDEDYEEEVFDEVADIIVPVLVEAAKSAGQRAQQSKIIADHAAALNVKDDEIDQLKCQLITKDRDIQQLKESFCEDANDKDAEIARLNKVVREMTGRLKSTAVVAPVQVPDTIQHQAGNTVGQWSLQYQG